MAAAAQGGIKSQQAPALALAAMEANRLLTKAPDIKFLVAQKPG